jgi:hypothetical protein
MNKSIGVACATLAAAALIAPLEASAATVTVTTTSNAGPGSLRAAIASAGSQDTIGFAPGVRGKITLTEQLVIDKSLAIEGPGSGALTISGNDATRVLFVNPGSPARRRRPSPASPCA